MEKLQSMRFTNIYRRLPPHILQVIFSKLSISNLPAFRLVSKTWNDLVLDYASFCKFRPEPFLCTSERRRIPEDNYPYPYCYQYCNPKIHCINTGTMSSVASFEFDSDSLKTFILNSCNGLMLICKHTDDRYYEGILNPMTNEFFKLPGYVIDECYNFGFGFSPTTNEYKLFKVSCRPIVSSCMMEIFRFGRNGTNEWKHFKCLPFNVYYHGAYLNGVIYWIGKENGNESVIYALDVETEKMERIATLVVGPHDIEEMSIETFNGSVYATIFMDEPSCKFQVWSMQEKDAWIRNLVIDDLPNGWENKLFRLIVTYEYEMLLFLVNGDLFRLDTTGKKVQLKTLNPGNRVITGYSNIDSLNFGSLPKILAGNQ